MGKRQEVGGVAAKKRSGGVRESPVAFQTKAATLQAALLQNYQLNRRGKKKKKRKQKRSRRGIKRTIGWGTGVRSPGRPLIILIPPS